MRLLLVVLMIQASVDAVPVVEEEVRPADDPVIGIVQLQKKAGDPLYGAGGEFENLSCEVLISAEEKGGAKSFRLFLKALRDYNEDLTDVHCLHAREQVAEGEVVQIEIEGTLTKEGAKAAKDETVRRICKVELRRTQPGYVDGTTPSDSDEAKEHDWYRIEMCTESNEDPELLELQKPWGLGYIDPTPEQLAQMRTAPERTVEELLQVPASHDERKKMNCPVGQAIQKQGSCGSCWAFAAVRAYDDRLCRKTGGKIDIALAEQDVLSCTKRYKGYFYGSATNGKTQLSPNGNGALFDGCNGAGTYDAYFTMAKEGRVPRKADKYTGKSHVRGDKCGSHASGHTEYKVASDSKGPRVFKLPDQNFQAVKAEIYHGGSVTLSWIVYQNGYDYKGGVYDKIYGRKFTGHATVGIGYGIASGKSYYLIANSWGTGWGEKGYMRMTVDAYKKIGRGMIFADPENRHQHRPHQHRPHRHHKHQSTSSPSALTVGSTVGLYSEVHKRYVKMEPNGKIVPNPAFGSWEKFKVVSGGGGQISLYSDTHKRYLRMHNKYLDSSKHHGSWEVFKAVDAGSGQIALWNPHHKRFIRMPGKDGRMDRSGQSGDGKLPGNWALERFKVICAANCPAYWAGTITWGAKSVNECNWQCSCKASQPGCNGKGRCKRSVFDNGSKKCALYDVEPQAYWAGTITWGAKSVNECNWQCSCKASQPGCSGKGKCKWSAFDNRSKKCSLYDK